MSARPALDGDFVRRFPSNLITSFLVLALSGCGLFDGSNEPTETVEATDSGAVEVVAEPSEGPLDGAPAAGDSAVDAQAPTPTEDGSAPQVIA